MTKSTNKVDGSELPCIPAKEPNFPPIAQPWPELRTLEDMSYDAIEALRGFQVSISVRLYFFAAA